MLDCTAVCKTIKYIHDMGLTRETHICVERCENLDSWAELCVLQSNICL